MLKLKMIAALTLLGLTTATYADQVRCSIAVSDHVLMRMNYQVNNTGAATSKALYQVFYDNGFAVQQSLEISKSEIIRSDDKIRMSAAGEGNTIDFEVAFKGGMDAYTGIARGILKDKPFERLIVCSLIEDGR